MDITMQNKDAVARAIAEYATDTANRISDAVYVNLLRVSEALERVGEIGSDFRTLKDFKTICIPTGEETVSNTTYYDALAMALQVVKPA